MVVDYVGRVAVFDIALQQKWSYFVSDERAPDYRRGGRFGICVYE